MPSADKSPSIRRRAGTASAVAQQSLVFELPPASNSEHVQAKPAERLWLCIHLPALPLEALGHNKVGHNKVDLARAVFDDEDGLRKVLLANSAAMSAGIAPGLSVNAALALLPALELEQRDLRCEQRALLNLAGWVERFTSFVAVEAPAILLLELAGSLRLFGGLQKLRKTISAGLGEQGFMAAMAIAPTPLAATWLARAGRRVCIRDMANLTGALSRLPLSCLAWPDTVYESLNSMGLTSVGDCLRLPRQGFAKRFGAGRLLQLDRALGRLPDPRVSFRTPERFSAELELTEELNDSDLILNACDELLQKLGRFLRVRQVAVQRVAFSFFHLQHPATHLPLGCVQPDQAVKHWFELLRIRFERLALIAPVIAIRLRAGQGQPMTAGTEALQFNKKNRQRQRLSVEHLIERLGARIGDGLVHGVTAVAEHRPHCAWRRELSMDDRSQCQAMPGFWYERQAPELLADIRKTSSLLLRRPLWLLTDPEPLAIRDGRPAYEGLLKLTDGPERLETGWWDEGGIARDYFVAVNPKGAHLWVYRDRNKQGCGWYLHGIFG